jgi:hypothetical protein
MKRLTLVLVLLVVLLAGCSNTSNGLYVPSQPAGTSNRTVCNDLDAYLANGQETVGQVNQVIENKSEFAAALKRDGPSASNSKLRTQASDLVTSLTGGSDNQLVAGCESRSKTAARHGLKQQHCG